MRVAKAIELDAKTDRELRVLSKRKRIEARRQQRARIMLLAAKGMQNKDIAEEVGTGSSPGGIVASSVPRGRHRCTAQGCSAHGPAAQRDGRDGVAHRAGH